MQSRHKAVSWHVQVPARAHTMLGKVQERGPRILEALPPGAPTCGGNLFRQQPCFVQPRPIHTAAVSRSRMVKPSSLATSVNAGH